MEMPQPTAAPEAVATGGRPRFGAAALRTAATISRSVAFSLSALTSAISPYLTRSSARTALISARMPLTLASCSRRALKATKSVMARSPLARSVFSFPSPAALTSLARSCSADALTVLLSRDSCSAVISTPSRSAKSMASFW